MWKSGSPFSGDRRILGSEFSQIVVAWLVLAFCFSVGALFTHDFPLTFIVALVTIGAGFVLHELSHRFIAKRFGYSAEFRIWLWGIILALMFSLASGGRFIFAAPGAVYITPMIKTFSLEHSIRRDSGLISLSGPLANIIIAILFLYLTGLGGILNVIGTFGYRINLWLAAFNLLPFGPLDGQKVFSWKPVVWVVITIPTWIMVFLPIIAI